MIIDTSINQFINDSLMRDNAEREAKHESSGKLSASMLYQPLRFQVLKTLGAPRKAIDPYVLGKFKRGNDVEDWYVNKLSEMGVLTDRQKMVEYRGVIGFVDAVVDSEKMQFKKGVMPHEVKSVTNAKLKRIAKTEIDWHYKMQACLYALALGSEWYAVDILSSEDLRPNVYIFPTMELKGDVDKAIDAYDAAMKDWKENKVLPKFEANPKCMWTGNLEYAMFAEEWAVNSDDWAIKQLEALKLI